MTNFILAVLATAVVTVPFTASRRIRRVVARTVKLTARRCRGLS